MPSAAWRNADAAARERKRRELRSVESGGGYTLLSMSPEWDPFFGSLHDQQEAAQAAGMNYRVDLGSIGRPGYEGMDPGGRPNNKFLAQTLAADDISRRLQAADAERDLFNKARQQQIINDLHTEYIDHVQASTMAPPVEHHTIEKTVSPGKADAYSVRPTETDPIQRILNRVPLPVRAQYEKQLADQAMRERQIKADEARNTETRRHNEATEKAAGAAKPLTATAESNLISKLATQWQAANKTSTEMDRQFQIMKTGLDRFEKDPNGASQAVLVTFQKMLDPESVVRESEYARSSQGIGLMGRMQGYMERLSRGGAGVPKAELEQMVETARQFRENTKDAPDASQKRIKAVADRYGIPHELVISLAGAAAPAPPAPAPGATAGRGGADPLGIR